MASKFKLGPVAAALGTTFAVTLAASPVVNAADNPFGMNEFSNGYMVAGHEEGKCGEGKCGDKGGEEGKCGEGKCGDKGSEKGSEEGKCGEGKCGDKG
jgi:uncharacterized low-complexity protein